MKNAFRLLSAGALLAAVVPTAAFAQASPQSTTVPVSATVTGVCLLSAPAPIAFGNVPAGSTANNQGAITITCNKGATVSTTATSLNVTGSQKRMQIGATGEFLNYTLWQPDLSALGACAGTQVDWTGAMTMTSLWTAGGGPKVVPLCATTSPTNSNANGTYNDTLTVTVTFS